MIERQVIVQWNKPEDKLPEEGVFVVVTINGKWRNVTFDHALALATWWNDGEGWEIEGYHFAPGEFTVLAWADLEPYKG